MSCVTSLGSVDEEKREAKLAQLQAVNDQRQVDKEKRKQGNANEADPEEHVASFLAQFNKAKQAAVDSIGELKLRQPATDQAARAPIKAEADSISHQLFKLDHSVSGAAYFLPPFEVRSLTAAVSSLRAELQHARDARLPHVPFAFSHAESLVLVTDPLQQGLQTRQELENAGRLPSCSQVVNEPSSNIAQDAATTISGKTKDRICLTASQLKGKDWMLEGLTDCVILLHGPLQALYLHRLRNCHVQAGPVSGATFGEDLTGCTIMVATHQLRLHKATKNTVYVRPGSDPIVEHCSAIAFAPLRTLPYADFDNCVAAAELPADAEMCAWARVQDFQFPGHETSPNWHVLETGVRRAAGDLDTCALPSAV